METRITFILLVWSSLLFNGILSAPSTINAVESTESTIVSTTTTIATPPTTDKPDSKLLASIEEVQKNFVSESSKNEDVRRSDYEQIRKMHVPQVLNRAAKVFQYPGNRVDLNADTSNPMARHRQDKMLGYFGYYPPMPLAQLGMYPQASPFFPQEYFGDYSSGLNDEDDIMSRANRRRPPQSNSIENSPIYYIRLPPTPYMFVPGYGYISNPPTITPMNAFAQTSPALPQHMPPYGQQSMPNPYAQQPNPYVPQSNPYAPQLNQINPFINLPLNFVANGKPTNVYQWSGAPAGYQPQPNPYQLGYQVPTMQPMQPRPQRPYKPKPSYLQDSKIHHLKGQYLFNGRPDEVFLLQQNSYNSLGYTNPMRHYY